MGYQRILENLSTGCTTNLIGKHIIIQKDSKMNGKTNQINKV